LHENIRRREGTQYLVKKVNLEFAGRIRVGRVAVLELAAVMFGFCKLGALRGQEFLEAMGPSPAVRAAVAGRKLGVFMISRYCSFCCAALRASSSTQTPVFLGSSTAKK
jgi:hypothetical protein